jgi:hypothetical protein
MRVVPHSAAGTLNPFCFHRKGRWYDSVIANAFNIPSMSLTSARLYTVPFYTGENVTIGGLGFNCTGAVASSHARMGIYENDIAKGARPKTLIIESTEFDTSTTGAKEFTWSTPLVRFRGGKLYWLAILANASIYIPGGYMHDFFLGSVGVESGGDPVPVQYLYSDMTYGNLPSAFPSFSPGSYKSDGVGVHPVLMVKITG